ncbi:hypothetical protein KC959_03885 [Candidatus Saccharibacteria bacterium]|nr:hypothetical protein [Candidatus Saccharibacteria bacterium]
MECEDENQGDWYGQTSWAKMLFSNIHPINSFDYFCDEAGDINAEMIETKVELRFEEVEGRTKVVSICACADEAALKTVMDMGMADSIAQASDGPEEELSEK